MASLPAWDALFRNLSNPFLVSHSLTSTLSPQQSGCLHWCRSCLVVAQLLFESLVAELSVAELSVVVSSVVVSLDVGLLVAESSVPGL